MIKRLFFLFILLSVQMYNVKSGNAFYSEASFFTQDSDFFLHTIERGETVFSIATLYHVSVEDIYKLNPESKESIKFGFTLKIPKETGSYLYHTIQPKETLYSVSRQYQMKGEDIIAVNPGLSIETFTIGKVIRIPTNIVTVSTEENNQAHTEALLTPPAGKKINRIKVALLLPFELNEVTTPGNAAKSQIVEYYEGFLMALNDLKKKNISVHLQVYDIGSKANQLESILKKPELQTVHLLIGGSSDEQIKLISNFSNKQGIPYVIPFTAKSDEPLSNHNIYQINTPQSYLYSKTSLEFYNKFKNSNIVFFNSGKKSTKSDLIKMIKEDLDAKKISYKTISSGSAIKNELNANKNTVFIPNDDSKETLSNLISSVKTAKAARSEASVSLFGYPSWQIYSTEYAADFFQLDVHFYTIFYANPSSPEVKSFYNNYFHWYSRDLINKYPRYGILGYDTGMYFIQLLDQFGTSYAANINKIKYEGIQTDFHFEQVSNWGGFINTNIYFIEFNPTSNKINTKRFY